MRKFLVIGLSMWMAFLLSACGGSDRTEASAAKHRPPATSEPSSGDSIEVAHAGDWGGLKRFVGGRASRVLTPQGPAPERVLIRDLKRGEGPVLRPRDVFVARYMSYGYADGRVLESNWTSVHAYTWRFGEVVDGWEPGLKGMHQGGIRELIVPSALAYGAGARVYLVQLVKVG